MVFGRPCFEARVVLEILVIQAIAFIPKSLFDGDRFGVFDLHPRANELVVNIESNPVTKTVGWIELVRPAVPQDVPSQFQFLSNRTGI